ncbi:MAG: hypothetical protein AB1631_16045 [Acidobacteriota bacterium]
MAEIKGVLINGWMGLLKDRYGETALTAAIESLDHLDRAALSAPFLPSSWYPYDTLQVLSRLTRKIGATGDEFALDIGKAMAQHACAGVYKSLIVSGPLKQVDRISWVGDMLYKNVRRCETERVSESSGLVRYIYESGVRPTAGTCRSVMGFLIRMMELAGARGVTASHHKCVVKGADCCEFLLEWK